MKFLAVVCAVVIASSSALPVGIIADFSPEETSYVEDDEEAYANTFRLLDAVVLDGASVKGGEVKWFIPEGKKEKCVDGVKEIHPRCRWSGVVAKSDEKGENIALNKEKFVVITKYCNRAGLTKPKPIKVKC
ncbi:uncharacterized protein LOC5514703 isoform X2 [Nematostella vectensis]|uniref:uncharacterized protein LOC5514703 isoform X2 n=1 Tax=Nematostella vectensis TaxID=45351 RepID=UPI00207707A1|nr:uncharacterized protein LOC5514703 isoform X2 [Nematostella vectensis]